MDKWFEEFGIYDFLGVMCPGIFALGIGYMFCDINHLSYINKEIVKHLGIKITGNNLQYFSYIYIIVAVYIFGSFIHEIGHMFSEIYSTGFNGISRLAERAINEQIPLCFIKVILNLKILFYYMIWRIVIKKNEKRGSYS